MNTLSTLPSQISAFLSASTSDGTMSSPTTSTFVHSRSRIFFHAFLVLFGSITWIWTAVRENAGAGYQSDYQAQYLLGVASLAGIGLVTACRIADLFTPTRFNLLRIRLEFTLIALLSYFFLSFTMAITLYTLHLWPETPTSSSNSSPPRWTPPPLNRAFVTITLFSSAIFQTLYFLLACNLLSLALVCLKGESALGEGETRVMWDLPAENEEEVVALGSPSTRTGGYGSLETGGLLVVEDESWDDAAVGIQGSGTSDGRKEGVEREDDGERRWYFGVLGALSLGVVVGSVGWVVWGYETDIADISLIVLSSLTTWISASYLFLPTHLQPLALLPSLKSHHTNLLPTLLPLLLYPIPTILFTLPPIPSYPPTSESNPSSPSTHSIFLLDTFIAYAPSLAILCAWAIQIWALFALVREVVPLPHAGWERDDETRGAEGAERRADLFFPPPERREEEEGLLSSAAGRRSAPGSPTTAKTTPRTALGGSWRRTTREDEERRKRSEFELEEEEVLDGEEEEEGADGEEGGEVVRLMSPPSSQLRF
ncbi:hypothetical protein BDY24DRAFT_386438 [Mrakia frigida]|uniref:uncharacterized protein n=1 Tax=Mrakia frigida TaxID=29902 RepID=UPI003FCC1C27